ncbi:DUF998 domain-containing protein [Ornithinimicrobium faecis]|uniref:DUF998 domain-containing protein n=1 Tax=Ornithinimicrobium faecis TaxID=2934158 RepID=A0ABY4YXM7_9MICO|nr:DUF998 domain-containing protein [Ornithinimicrobium sp. HY1793]USQ81108.1 DUF998 domain-containing protein [Ornithinimicrobium sp. HY1793]
MAPWIGALGAALFVLVFLIDGATRPGYSPTRHTVSALALGPRGWLQRANFLVCGAAITAGAVGLLISGDHRMLGLVLTIFGLGLVVSVIPMDPMRGYPPGAQDEDPTEFSAAHSLHDGAGALVFFALPVISVVSAFALPGVAWTVAAVLVTIVLMAALAAFQRGWHEDSPSTGTAQRAVLVPGLLWVAAVFLGFS